jgi:hypothetical protein
MVAWWLNLNINLKSFQAQHSLSFLKLKNK